jgi:hypothetical protein
MYKNLYFWVLATSLIILFSTAPLPVAAEGDLCREKGITVRNATMIDLWYRKNGGECSIWVHEHLFTLKPGDRMGIFSDSDCQTPYCPHNPKFKSYKSIDTGGNCRVKILPDCILADM